MISATRVALLVVLACMSSACLAPQPEPDRLVFSSYTPSNWDIYLFEGRGASARALTTHPALDYEPTFSADGRWVVFTSERGGINDEEPLVQEILFGPQMYGDIYAYHLRDGYLVRLTHNKWEDGAPFWVDPALAPRPPM
jgi:Tol biopolymer transport system component